MGLTSYRQGENKSTHTIVSFNPDYHPVSLYDGVDTAQPLRARLEVYKSWQSYLLQRTLLEIAPYRSREDVIRLAQSKVRLGVDKLIMGVRNLQKGETAKREILAASENRDQSSIEVWTLEMDSYDSVRAFASRASSLPRLDAVLANAGVMTAIFSVTEDNEKTITTNVVSTFLLALLLLPKPQQSAEQFGTVPRIVIPNSALHYLAPLKELEAKEGEIFTRLNDEKTADMGNRYLVSKLLIIYVVRELADQLKASNKSLVIINTPNLSFRKSQLIRDPGLSTSFGVKIGEKLFARSTEAGSRALVHGILSGPESNGHYMTSCHIQAQDSHKIILSSILTAASNQTSMLCN